MTQLRRRLLHCINLSRPHTGKVIFYYVCQSLINPCQLSILTRRRVGEHGETYSRHLTTLSFPPSLCLSAFFFILYSSQLSAYLPFTHLALTPSAFSFFFLHHMKPPNISSRGAHFSQMVMNASGSRIDFQTETISGQNKSQFIILIFLLYSVSPFKVTRCIWVNTWAKA